MNAIVRPAPCDIDTTKRLIGNFHIVAQHILWGVVMVAQEKNEWRTFTVEDIKRYCLESSLVVRLFLDDFALRGYLKKEGNIYEISDSFFECCAQQ